MKNVLVGVVLLLATMSCGKSDRTPEIQLNDGKDGEQGPQGPKGDKGDPGQGCTAEYIEGGIQVTCSNGVFVVKHGQDGENGKNGENGNNGQNGENGNNGKDGNDGASIGLAISDAPKLVCENGGMVMTTWKDINNNGTFDPGEPNYNQRAICNGLNGENGKDGKSCTVDRVGEKESKIDCGGTPVIIRDGEDGKDGKDGQGCYITDHPEGAAIVCGDDVQIVKDGKNGENGKDGANGADGKDGAGCHVEALPDQNASKITCGNTVQIIKNGKDGIDGKKGNDGKDGKNGESCKVKKDDKGAITIDCGAGGKETIPPERTVTICLCWKGWPYTKTYKVSDFIADIYGRYNYSMGACR